MTFMSQNNLPAHTRRRRKDGLMYGLLSGSVLLKAPFSRENIPSCLHAWFEKKKKHTLVMVILHATLKTIVKGFDGLAIIRLINFRLKSSPRLHWLTYVFRFVASALFLSFFSPFFFSFFSFFFSFYLRSCFHNFSHVFLMTCWLSSFLVYSLFLYMYNGTTTTEPPV